MTRMRSFAAALGVAAAVLFGGSAQAQAPVNDRFAGAIEVPQRLKTVVGNNAGAETRREPGEPLFPGRLETYGSVWYSFRTGPKAGLTLITTYGTRGNTGFATQPVLDVFTGSRVTALRRVVAGDFQGGTSSDRTRVAFPTRANTTYSIRVSSTSTFLGSFRLTLDHFGPDGGFAVLPLLQVGYGGGTPTRAPIYAFGAPDDGLNVTVEDFLVVNATRQARRLTTKINASPAYIFGGAAVLSPIRAGIPGATEISAYFREARQGQGPGYWPHVLRFDFSGGTPARIDVPVAMYRWFDQSSDLAVKLLRDGVYRARIGFPVVVTVDVTNRGFETARSCSLTFDYGSLVGSWRTVLGNGRNGTAPINIPPKKTQRFQYIYEPAELGTILGYFNDQLRGRVFCANTGEAVSTEGFEFDVSR